MVKDRAYIVRRPEGWPMWCGDRPGEDIEQAQEGEAVGVKCWRFLMLDLEC